VRFTCFSDRHSLAIEDDRALVVLPAQWEFSLIDFAGAVIDDLSVEGKPL